ncbi:MAG: triose-phosphate isomerase [Motiliproteus sp.]
MRQPLVAGNWKMNGSSASISELMAALKPEVSNLRGVDVAVCPPAAYLDRVASLVGDSGIGLGAQAASEFDHGAYTGETSVAMLKELGCRYVLLGHSERRALFAETDQQVAAKYLAAKQGGLVPVLCVGETLDQRERGQAESVIAAQLNAVIDAHGVESLQGAVVAYEPVWAIGTGKTASPEQAQQIHSAIRQLVAQKSPSVANQLVILYGGSVNSGNAESLFSMADIDGGLVGGASLKADEFIAICRAAQSVQ